MSLLLLIILLLPSDPNGTVKVGNFYVDQTETLNIHWLAYVHFKKQELSSAEHWRLLPNSANNWYDSPNRRFEPITFISYEQAVDYCAWRSEVVSKKSGIPIIYRMPNISEWNLIAEKILIEDQKKVAKELNKLKRKLVKTKNQFLLTNRATTKNEVYDLFSNVSEMTSVKGIAKGGNNHELLNEDDLTADIKYKDSNAYLGFRCIVEFNE